MTKKKGNDHTNKDKRGIIVEKYLFIMNDNNNYTNLIPSNLPIKLISIAINNNVLFRDQVVTQAVYDTGTCAYISQLY